MSDKPVREWHFYVDDMIGFAEKVLGYTFDVDKQAFVSSSMMHDAVIRNLELIGEAATHVPESVQSANPKIPWRLMIATRNRLIHAYLGIDEDIIWSIVRDDIPALIPLLRQLKKAES